MFHKLVIPRISLIMFKNDMGLVPQPISQLFTKKQTMNTMITILDTVVLFISQLGEVKQSTDLLAFMELAFEII